MGETGGGRVLVTDDDAAIRRSLERGLRLNGFSVTLADGGHAALAAVRDGAPDVVVLDISMPDLSGIEVCRALRGDGDDVPVLMLSALDEVADRVAGLQAGGDDYLVKPFALQELVLRLHAASRRGRPSDEGDRGDQTGGGSGRYGVGLGADQIAALHDSGAADVHMDPQPVVVVREQLTRDGDTERDMAPRAQRHIGEDLRRHDRLGGIGAGHVAHLHHHPRRPPGGGVGGQGHDAAQDTAHSEMFSPWTEDLFRHPGGNAVRAGQRGVVSPRRGGRSG
ncbi:response regulator transcription factor [Streptomyces antimycoticus]|uniref:response regulator transcription factor n=1 Tax=Streptomyces antimycoticus TaxID=68175 RepID=UPI002570AC3D|nr:response regulator [Streptomyces antimycoticus]WJD98327.1 response regulator [Streptomyces antimycoticus]